MTTFYLSLNSLKSSRSSLQLSRWGPDYLGSLPRRLSQGFDPGHLVVGSVVLSLDVNEEP